MVVEIPPPQTPNTLTLKKLDAASQAGRVQYPGQTRGQKADRLQLVAKIAPVADGAAETYHWSATGISIANGNAYVSWHSDHQAQTPADRWGGAVDVISISALQNKEANVISNTITTGAVKFNNIVVNGQTAYLPVTSYSNGASVARWVIGTDAMDTIAVPGSSANSVKVDGGDLYVISGYKGGLYKVNSNFGADVENTVETIVEMRDDFGGKYIAGDYYLRTDAEKSQIVNLDGTVRNEGAPLLSANKFAEKYDHETNTWVVQGTNQARYYGKHTMAVDGNHIYVGGGQSDGNNVDSGKNGLRVYNATGLAWENGTNTTAVCVDGDYVYAATGAGLRVYEKFNGTDLPLYAFEVLNYDENGNAADAPGLNYPVAGTDAHSPNFVAVGGGYIFVANGQSGVYVFKLNPDAPVQKIEVSLSIPDNDGEKEVKGEIDETDENGTLTVPEGKPTTIPEDKDFAGWSENPEDPEAPIYKPGDKVPVSPEKPNVELKPVFTDKAKSETGFKTTTGVSDTEQLINGTKKNFTVPAAPAEVEGKEFQGWKGNDGKDYTAGTEVELEAGTVVTLEPVYKDVFEVLVSFDPDGAEGTVPATKGGSKLDKAEVTFVMPGQGELIMPVGQKSFKGWSPDNATNQGVASKVYEPGKEYTFTESVKLYPVWSTTVFGGAGEGSGGSEI